MAATIHIKHEANQELLIITVSGKHTISYHTTLADPVIAQLIEKNCTRCLIDYRNASLSVEVVPTVKRSEFFESKNLPRYIKFAVVFQEIPSETRFFETAMMNRGWNFRFFTAMDKAMNWLE